MRVVIDLEQVEVEFLAAYFAYIAANPQQYKRLEDLVLLEMYKERFDLFHFAKAKKVKLKLSEAMALVMSLGKMDLSDDYDELLRYSLLSKLTKQQKQVEIKTRCG